MKLDAPKNKNYAAVVVAAHTIVDLGARVGAAGVYPYYDS